VTDYNIKVTSDIQDAEKKLDKIDKLAEKVEKTRNLKFDIPSFSDIEKGFADIENKVTSAANNVRKFYDTTKNMPVIGDVFKPIKETEEWARKLGDTGPRIARVASGIKEVSTASGALETGMRSASSASNILVTKLAQIGFSLYALKEGTNILKAAFGGLFDETIGRQIQLQETILKTQTTLASTNRVFKNGTEITDPYQKIVGLTDEIGQNIDNIRARSIELAGVTSNDVIEVFGIVAGQIGQIGGGLKEAEDLAINFAAALGTFGLPLYQARQEIGSILRGDITMDSYLAKSLGITNKDIVDAKSKAGGIVAFLQDKLGAAVAGQKIAAQGFRGVYSNIKDLQELIGQKFGAGLLGPLVGGLTKVFDTLNKIKGQIFDISSKAGSTVGNIITAFSGQVRGRVADSSPESDRTVAFADKARDIADKAFSAIERVATRSIGAVSRIIAALAPTVENIVQSFALLAKTFLEIKVANFETLLSLIANMTEAAAGLVNTFSGLFKLYAGLLSQPIVKYFSEITTTLGLLKRAGLDTIVTMVALFNFIKGTVGPVMATVIGVIGGVIVTIGTLVGAIGALMLSLAGVATAFITPLAFIKGAKVALTELTVALQQAGKGATDASAKFTTMGVGMKGLANGAKGMALSLASSLVSALAFQVAITVVLDAFMRFQRAQEEAAADKRAELALVRLATTYKDVGDSADAATKAARDFERSVVNTSFNKKIQELEELRKKINDLKYDMQTPGINSFAELLAQLGSIQNPNASLSGVEPGISKKSIQQNDLDATEKRKVDIELAISKIARALDRDRAMDNFKIQADNAKQLAKDQKDLDKERQNIERSHKDKMFDMQQQLDNKALDIFKLTSDITIRQIELRNKKLIEGENGAAGAALNALNDYISTKKKAELSLEATKRQLQVQAAALDKSVVDYRLSVEERILAIKERIGKFEMDVANYVLAQKQNEAAVLAAGGQNGEGNILPGGVITPTANGGGFTSPRTRAGGVVEAHGAQDIGAAPGSRVNARLAGTLINILKNFGGNGDAAVVKYDSGETGTYGHIRLGSDMRVGSRVSPGMQIGTINNPPPGYDPHLHYKLVDVMGKLVDPVNTVANSLKIKGNASSTGGGIASNMFRFLSMVAMGESTDNNSAINRSSGTLGRFQFKDSTRTDALTRGLLTPAEAANLLADDKNKQFSAVSKYIRALNPVAAGYIDAGDFNNAELMLSGARVGKGGNALFTSLKGGAEAATGPRRAAMEKALGSGNSAVPTAFTVSQPVMNLKNLPAIQTREYRDAVDALKALNTQFAALQARLDTINSKAQFTDILKNLYPKRDFKELDNSVENLKISLRTISEEAGKAFDPEIYQIDMEEAKAKAAINEQTLIWLQKYKNLKGVTAQEVAALEKDEAARRKVFLADLEKEYDLKRELVVLTRAQKYAVELKDNLEQATTRQSLSMLQMQSDRSALFRAKNDYVGTRLSSTNLQIEQERLSKSQELKDPATASLFERNAAALRSSAVALGNFEGATAKVAEKLAMAHEATSTFITGFKGIFRAALSGGDIGESVKSFTEGFTGKILDMFSEYAFNPLEKQMDAVFSKFLGVKNDPMVANTTALTNVSTAVDNLTAALYSSATGAVNNIVNGPRSLSDVQTSFPATLSSFSPESAFGAAAPGMDTSIALASVTKNLKEIAPAATQAASGLQTTLGGITSLATGAATIFGGISQMGKGGTYNTLSGLAGIFGGIGGLLGGGLFSKGGVFGGARASGGPVLSGRSYLVGENGPELFSPSGSGAILPADATAGMFQETRAALPPMSTPSSPSSFAPPGVDINVKYQSQTIGSVNYVTEEQFQEGMRQGMRQAAHQGRDLAYSGMHGDPRIRKALGLA
jgi:murein DD-endopeptidase MepM/ murein hydrolase activator NlpD